MSAPMSSPARVAAIVLAAGRSTRMGPANKLLARFRDQPMIRHAVQAAVASRAAPVVVVTGHEAPRMRRALDGFAVTFVHNVDHEQGMSTSLRAGLAALPEGVDGALFLLGDMPRVTAVHIDGLLDGFAAGAPICVPVHGRERGNPVLWPARHFDQIRGLAGDVGAKHLLAAHASEITRVEMRDAGILVDVDTSADLARQDGGVA